MYSVQHWAVLGGCDVFSVLGYSVQGPRFRDYMEPGTWLLLCRYHHMILPVA